MFGPDSKIGQLVNKMVERQKEIEAQKNQMIEILGSEKGKLRDRDELMAGVNELSKLNAEEFGKKIASANQKEEEVGDMNMMRKELKAERERKRAEKEVVGDKDRSAGELALMFMGINQVAYDLLVENPMTGYMNEIIFTRILGHEDIEQGAFWTDGTQCWICQKWNKITISYDLLGDKQVFAQKL